MQAYSLQTFAQQDLQQVHALECAANDFPWSEQAFADSIKAGHACYCYRQAEQIIAFAIISQVLDEATLLNIVVAQCHQRQGLGRQLLQQCLQRSQANGANMCMLEVRRSNKTALKLYYELGFYEVGQRADYYPSHKGREDALLLCLPLEFYEGLAQ